MSIMTCRDIQSAMSSSKHFCSSVGSCHMKLKPEDLNTVCMYTCHIFLSHCLIETQGYYTDFAGQTSTQQIYWYSLYDLISFFTNTRTFLHMISFLQTFPETLFLVIISTANKIMDTFRSKLHHAPKVDITVRGNFIKVKITLLTTWTRKKN